MKYPNGYFREKSCRTCGLAFIPEAPSQKYCGAKCRGKTSYYERNYGITESIYREMQASQGNRCALCGSSGFVIAKCGTEKFAVDHDHASGKVRACLCHNCNRALGLFQDDPSLMRRAADYVELHREGATTIPQGSTAKRPEAHSPVQAGDDMVYSAEESVAAKAGR